MLVKPYSVAIIMHHISGIHWVRPPNPAPFVNEYPFPLVNVYFNNSILPDHCLCVWILPNFTWHCFFVEVTSTFVFGGKYR